jgi:hypothetical protein
VSGLKRLQFVGQDEIESGPRHRLVSDDGETFSEAEDEEAPAEGTATGAAKADKGD